MLKSRCMPWILLLALCCAGCGEAPDTPEATDPAEETRPTLRGETAGFQWAILPVESGSSFYSDWGPFFRPDAKTVRKALAGVKNRVQAETERQIDPKVGDTKIWHQTLEGLLKKFPHYRCQVIGVTGEDGRPFLYLNFNHERVFRGDEDAGSESGRDWTQEPMVVFDGGDWHWQVHYFPATDSYEEMSINGEA